VGLAKICRKHGIPCPPPGYWAKLQHGKECAQTPLPERDNDVEIAIRDSLRGDSASLHLGKSILHQVETERTKETRIELSDSLRGAHELVRRANQELQSACTNEHNIIVCPDNSMLNVVTSKASLRRALLIMDALLKALERRDYEVSSGPTVTIFETSVRFGITESLEARREPCEDHNLDGAYEFGHNRFNERRQPSGRLSLEIQEGAPYWASGCRRTWRDTKTKRLEDRLSSFMAGLITMAARIKEHNEEQEREAELRRQEELVRHDLAP